MHTWITSINPLAITVTIIDPARSTHDLLFPDLGVFAPKISVRTTRFTRRDKAKGTRTRPEREESVRVFPVSSTRRALIFCFSLNSVELPGEVARLLSELRDENRALWREIRRIPQLVSPAAIPANFVGSSQGSQSHVSPHAQVALGGGHVLTQSRSSSNLGGDDSERDVDWGDEEGMSASVCGGPMTGIEMGVGGSQGGEELDAQNSRFGFAGGSGLNLPGLGSNGFGTASGGEEWKRWAQSEIIKERKRVQRLVAVVKALVDVSGRGGASTGPASSVSTAAGVDGESDGRKF